MPPKALITTTFFSSLIWPCLVPTSTLPILACLSSVITLQWSFDEYYFLSAWLDLPRPSASQGDGSGSGLGLKMSQYYLSWSDSLGSLFPILSLPVSWVTSARCAYTIYRLDRDDILPLTLYGLGFGLALAHIPSGGRAFPIVGKLRKAGERSSMTPQEDAEMIRSLRTWTEMHWRRTLLVDLPSTVCVIAGAIIGHRFF